MSHLVTYITDQKETWQQSHDLLELAMLFFATPPLTINAIYDLSAYGGHHHADSWQLLKGTQSHLGRAGMLVSWRSLLPYLTISLTLAHSAGNIDGGTNKDRQNCTTPPVWMEFG